MRLEKEVLSQLDEEQSFNLANNLLSSTTDVLDDRSVEVKHCTIG